MSDESLKVFCSIALSFLKIEIVLVILVSIQTGIGLRGLNTSTSPLIMQITDIPSETFPVDIVGLVNYFLLRPINTEQRS